MDANRKGRALAQHEVHVDAPPERLWALMSDIDGSARGSRTSGGRAERPACARLGLHIEVRWHRRLIYDPNPTTAAALDLDTSSPAEGLLEPVPA